MKFFYSGVPPEMMLQGYLQCQKGRALEVTTGYNSHKKGETVMDESVSETGRAHLF